MSNLSHQHTENLIKGLNELKISTTFVSPLLHYLELLEQWNRAYNLTAIRDPADMVIKHLLDSLVVQPHLHGARILDVGTGAGLPGIPLALLNPEKEFILLDSNGKKMRFLTEVVRQLNLSNVHLEQQRSENFRDTKGFDSIVSRAFAALSDMLRLTQHLLAPKGQFLAMKGDYPSAELAILPAEFQVIQVHALHVPFLEAKRHLVCMSKLS